MRPLLLAGLRNLFRHPGRVLQVAFAVALGIALFVSSYMSISGVERSIQRAARAVAGNADWVVTGSAAGGLPDSLVDRLRQVPGLVAAPFVKASATVLGPRPTKLQIWGIDTRSDAMLKLFGGQHTPDPETAARMVLVPNSVIVSSTFAKDRGLKRGSILPIASSSGAINLTVAGVIDDSGITQSLGAELGLVDVQLAEQMFGQPGRIDSIQVSGISLDRLKTVATGYEVRSLDELSPAARDALLRVQSLYGLSLVAMLIGCFVVFSSVQVTILERMKVIATLRAIGASRVQLLSAILLEWVLVGFIGSLAGVLFGALLSSAVLRGVTGSVNSMLPVVSVAHAEMTWPTFLLGLAIGMGTVLAAAAIPSFAAVGESPLLALRPHTYRLRHQQLTAFWVGVCLVAVGLGLSITGSYARTLISITLTFLGLALLMPQVMVVSAHRVRGTMSKLFGYPGFLAADNLQKAPQRTAFNVIALGGALAILVSTSALVDGFTVSTHRWIRASLPFDISVTASGFGNSTYSEETLPRTLLQTVSRVPGVSFVYGVRKSFAPFEGHDVMVIGLQTVPYLEAHRRHGTLNWAHLIADPDNRRELLAGHGIFASENFLALTGKQVGKYLDLRTPNGVWHVKLLGPIEDYSWPRGLLVTDLDVMNHLWRGNALTYVDAQVAELSQLSTVKGRISEATRAEYAVALTDREQIIGVADTVLRQSTSAADAQVWLASIIGFLGIGNSLIIGVLQRRREIGLLRAIGMSNGQLQRTVALEALLIGIGAGLLGAAGGLVGGWMPLRHFTFAVTGYLFPCVVPWAEMAKVVVGAVVVATLAAVIPMRRAAEVPVLTSIAAE